jgi:sterol desaturase/sphingolipid hydroxylase (fatty acid hydroxylase superfamily)
MEHYNWFYDQELLIRLGFFFGILLILAVLETLFPKRQKYGYQATRWVSNLTIVAVNGLCVRLIFPLMAVDVAYIAHERGWGLFNHQQYEGWIPLVFGVLILDFSIYLQHIIFHYVPVLWRFHRVHHTDLDFDVTTGVRFHPVEILLSMGIKMCVVLIFGISYLAVLAFEVILNASSLFTHTNLWLPKKFEKVVRTIFVTPDMHRIHHSIIRVETNSNFGFNLSIWDRICGTYRKNPKKGHQKMTIGIEEFRKPKFLQLKWLFAIPFIHDDKTGEE